MTGLHRHEAGNTAIEFALTLPILLVMLFGIIEGGKVVWTQQSLQHGAQMAARCAAIDTTKCKTSQQVASFASTAAWGIDPDTSLISVSDQACGSQVMISYPYDFLYEIGAGWTLTLRAASCFPHG